MLIFYLLLIFGVGMLPRYFKYKGSAYKNVSDNSFLKTVFNKGNYGEFLTFYLLEKLTGHQQLLTNLYIPKKDGLTTEVDLIMISETGIYVFESKNYSGWIFGDEKQKNWTQTLPDKQKNKFFNPIWQNNGHITALKQAIEIDDPELYKSYIIFSERCTLKKINLTSMNVKVIKRNKLLKTLKKDIEESVKVISPEQIDDIYRKLGKYCLVDDRLKQAHINEIQLKKVNF